MADDGSTMDRWLTSAAQELGVEPLDRVGRDRLLDVTRDVAHGVARPAAPLTAYLLGLAIGAGADPETAARQVSDLAAGWEQADG